jgi:ADP-ribose pyrophosphatase YjhB (NUDIX family)
VELDSPERLLAEVDRLRREWGDLPFEEHVATIGVDEYEHHREACYPDRTFLYAGALVERDGRLLLVEPEWADGWAEPGGTHEPGERVEETARREVWEETGIAVELTGVWRVQIVEETAEGRPPLWTLGATFEAEPVGGDLRPEPGEIDEVGWFETLPDALAYEDLAESVPERFR